MASATLKSAQESRIKSLRDKHVTLSHRVEEAQRSPGTSDEDIRLMKKQKLMVKEEITRISA